MAELFNAESTLLGYILLNNVPFESGHVIDKLMACTFTVDCVVDVTLSWVSHAVITPHK